MWKIARRGQRPAARADVLPSPNIWYHTDTYELENRAQDVGDDVWRVLARECDWAGKDVLDVGCGDGFHLSRFAATAKSVTGVEPHEPLARRAERRVGELPSVRVLRGSAQSIPVPDASADVVHARTAYFFGPGCEPGLREADRVLRPGGALVVVDLDVSSEPYGRWMRADLPDYDAAAVDAFFERQGFRCRRVMTRWWFADSESLAAVLRIEFSPEVADRAIADVLRDNGSHGRHPGAAGFTVPVGYRVLVRDKPSGLVLPGHSSSSSSSVSISPSTA
ncbi:class I SAM-dependent methyltransferase [Amycolatopsis endophytica]|uniref:SAM-dependent methyltransferase n=1 Tax=Amycolatopsis endophytica TaxID=860233 RepID=A0A853AW36_9PSEU|nr:class I SAM-dependent methyltransferase [Amycolatopsis endophytica]NYI86859.1 SAM-dependent methyltransferase [Amycolatopsis endophytica]